RQSRTASDSGGSASGKRSPDSEDAARENWKTSRTGRGHYQTGDGAEHSGGEDGRDAVVANAFAIAAIAPRWLVRVPPETAAVGALPAVHGGASAECARKPSAGAPRQTHTGFAQQSAPAQKVPVLPKKSTKTNKTE